MLLPFLMLCILQADGGREQTAYIKIIIEIFDLWNSSIYFQDIGGNLNGAKSQDDKKKVSGKKANHQAEIQDNNGMCV